MENSIGQRGWVPDKFLRKVNTVPWAPGPDTDPATLQVKWQSERICRLLFDEKPVRIVGSLPSMNKTGEISDATKKEDGFLAGDLFRDTGEKESNTWSAQTPGQES